MPGKIIGRKPLGWTDSNTIGGNEMNKIQNLMDQKVFIPKIYLMNTSIITGGEGVYRLELSSVQEFIEIINYVRTQEEKGKVVSAIGHKATADLFSILINEVVEVNRLNVEQKPYELGLIIKLRGRIPEGTVLQELSDIEEIGYNLFVLHREAGYSK